ncbi:hypothetical protein C0992_002367 [Termitomyces sp. T32_za158]|nr:hypothetical protein C0992_002367 [Termitomyces sp. T32_za158]
MPPKKTDDMVKSVTPRPRKLTQPPATLLSPDTSIMESPSQRNLRPRAEPSMKLMPRTRRTSEQVRVDQAEKEKAKQDRIQSRLNAIEGMAHLENSMQQADKDDERSAHHPPRSTQKKVSRPANIQDSVDIDPTIPKTPKVSLVSDDNSDPEDCAQDEDYWHSDSGMQLEDSASEIENDTSQVKKALKGAGQLRLAVNTARELLEQPSGDSGQKRKVSTHWSSDSISNLVPAAADSDSEQLGGISDDDGETAERRGLVEDDKPYTSGLIADKVLTFAKIVPTTSVPEFISPSLRRPKGYKQFTKRKAEVRLSDLPRDVQRKWDSEFTPHLCTFFGQLTPWTKIDDAQVNEISALWSHTFPSEKRLEEEPELSFYVLKLVDDALGAWRHSFSSSAAHFLENVIFADTELQSTDARATWATWALGSDFDGIEAHSRRFYYRDYEDADEELGKLVKARGIFQSPLMAHTLAVHYSSLKKLAVPQGKLNKPKYPAAALCMAILAVRMMGHQFLFLALAEQGCYHNINKWTNGKKDELGGKHGYFSAGNYKDHYEVEKGKKVSITLTSDVMNIIESLTEKHWSRIEAEAMVQVKARRTTAIVEILPSPAGYVKKVINIVDQDSDSNGDSEGHVGTSDSPPDDDI